MVVFHNPKITEATTRLETLCALDAHEQSKKVTCRIAAATQDQVIAGCWLDCGVVQDFAFEVPTSASDPKWSPVAQVAVLLPSTLPPASSFVGVTSLFLQQSKLLLNVLQVHLNTCVTKSSRVTAFTELDPTPLTPPWPLSHRQYHLPPPKCPFATRSTPPSPLFVTASPPYPTLRPSVLRVRSHLMNLWRLAIS